MRKTILALSSALVLTSCVGIPDFNASQPLAAGEDLVLMSCSTHHTVSRYLAIFEPDFQHAFINTKIPLSIKCSQSGNMEIIRMKTGTYYVSVMDKTLTKEEQLKALNFKIQPNKLNYVGDFVFSHSSDGKVNRIGIGVADNFAQTTTKLKAERPDVASQYKIISAVAKVPVDQK